MAHLEGKITSIVSRDEFTGESVVRIGPAGDNPRRISYPFRCRSAYGFFKGELVRIEGEWEEQDSTYGKIFNVSKIERQPPTTREGEITFLTGYIKGLRKSQATELLEKFGGLEGLAEVCKKRPQELDEVMPRARVLRARLRKAEWDRDEVDVDMFVALRSAGLRSNQINQLVKYFGAKSLRHIAQNSPYDFCRVPKVGFSSAEKVAKFYAEAQGREVDLFNEERLIYGLADTVAQERSYGHVCVPEERVLSQAMRLLRLPKNEQSMSRVREALDLSLKRRVLIREYDTIYTRGLHKAESDLALHINKLMLSGARALPVSRNAIVRELKDTGLSEEQKEAVAILGNSAVSILVGGPGRGKTWTLSFFLKLLEKYHKTYKILAPTGKAAKRAAEVTGKECFTIHKACGLDSEGDVHDKKYGRKLGRRERFRESVIIIDEASMIDLSLGYELVRRVKSGRTALVFVGDPDQLPPVGAGQVLRDLLNAEAVPIARLTQVFRQAGGSPLVDAADAINSGKTPEFQEDGYTLRLFDPTEAKGHPGARYADLASDYEVNIIRNWLAKGVSKYAKDLDIDPLHDIQVYAPQKNGPLGLNSLNEVLQNLVNPAPSGTSQSYFKIYGGFSVRVGDKVMQIQNNYRLRLSSASTESKKVGRTVKRASDIPEKVAKEHVSVMNGQIGTVTRLDTTRKEIEVTFEYMDEPVLYLQSKEWRQLAPAYAISIHRSQGSETPYAFIILHDSMNPKLVNRPLIYTAVTRAKEGVALFSTKTAVTRAAENMDGVDRFSNLGTRLSEMQSSGRGGNKKIMLYME